MPESTASTTPILTVDRKDFSDTHFFGLDPVLITSGLEKDWPAMVKWSPETLRAMNLENEVKLNLSQDGSFKLNAAGLPADTTNHKVVKSIPFSKAIDAIMDAGDHGPKYYISQINITKKLPELLSDIQIWHRTLVAGPNLWFGSAGVQTQLHYDEGINIFAQIYGVKKFVVYPPEDSPKLYPYPSGSTLSRVDYNNPDLECFPAFADAKSLVITVRAGEILLLPPFWWHYVESQSISISVNQWFTPALHQLIGSEALKWLVGEFNHDRWMRYRSSNRLSKEDMISSSLALYQENPEIALMAAASALDEVDNIHRTPSSLELKTYFEEILASVLKSNSQRSVRAQDLEKPLQRVAALVAAA